MRTQIQKWGNTLVVCIPDPVAEEIHLQQGIPVEISVEEDRLVIDVPKNEEERITLEELLAGITEQNVHREIDTGIPVGNEVW